MQTLCSYQDFFTLGFHGNNITTNTTLHTAIMCMYTHCFHGQLIREKCGETLRRLIDGVNGLSPDSAAHIQPATDVPRTVQRANPMINVALHC